MKQRILTCFAVLLIVDLAHAQNFIPLKDTSGMSLSP